jgi:hypothetical protein
MTSQFNTRIDFTLNSYLSECDLLNKYNISNLKQQPKLDQIVVDFPISEIIKASDISNKTENDPDIQLKAFLMLYILTSFIPYIRLNKIKKVGQTRTTDLSYSLKIILSNKEEINLFLNSFFLETFVRLQFEDFKLFKQKPQGFNKALLVSNKIAFTTKIPGHSVFEIDQILNKIITGINPRDLNLNINFLFSNFNHTKNFKTSIKNMPFFWISE